MSKYYLLILLILFVSCYTKPDTTYIPELKIDQNGVVVEQPYVWKTSLSTGSYIATSVNPQIIYNNRLLMGCSDNKQLDIVLVDIETGDKEWQSNFHMGYFAAIKGAYQKENKVVSNSYVSDFQCLDLITGENIWNIDTDGWFWPYSVTGIDDVFFLCGDSKKNPKPFKIEAVWYGDMKTGEINELYYPDMGIEADTSGYILEKKEAGGVERAIPYKNLLNEILLVIYYRSYVTGPRGEDFFSLYNFSKKGFDYQDVKLQSTLHGTPYISSNKVYFTLNEGVCCYDLETKEKLWSNNISIPYGRVISGGKLYGIDHGYDSYLVCIDLGSGKEEWRTLSDQCIAPMHMLNGIIYFVSSGECKLHAYDAETGKQLWHIESPDFKNDEGAFFKPECSVVPGKNGEKGKVIVSSYFNAFCYEAIR